MFDFEPVFSSQSLSMCLDGSTIALVFHHQKKKIDIIFLEENFTINLA